MNFTFSVSGITCGDVAIGRSSSAEVVIGSIAVVKAGKSKGTSDWVGLLRMSDSVPFSGDAHLSNLYMISRKRGEIAP